MKILMLTDDRLGSAMAGSALRAWELANALAGAGHQIRLAAARGSSIPHDSPVSFVERPTWSWAEAVVAPPWSLHLPAFMGCHLLVIDGATPLLAELEAMPATRRVRHRRRTAAARLPLVVNRAHAVLAAGRAQREWWQLSLRHRPAVPVIEIPFGVPDNDPTADAMEIPGVPPGWSVVLWWGGVWPWLDLETLLEARALLGEVPVSVVVPTASRPGASATHFTAADLERSIHRYGLVPPQVVALDRWVAYDERHTVLNRAAVVTVLHHPGREADLAFRTRAMDALWTDTPLLLSAGGEVARLTAERGWGRVVPPHDPAAVAGAVNALLAAEEARCRTTLDSDRRKWRWSQVAEPLLAALPTLSTVPRGALVPSLFRAAKTLIGLGPSEDA